MVFLPSSPTRIHSVHKGKTTLLPRRAGRGKPEQPSEMNDLGPSSQQAEGNAAVGELTSKTTEHATSIRQADETFHARYNVGEMLPRIAYSPSTSPDAGSESEHSPAGDVSPVVGRASSVRVGKAQLIEHWPSSNARKSKRQSNGHRHSRSSSRSSLEAEQVSDSRSYELPIMPEEGVQESARISAAPVTGNKDSPSIPPMVMLDKPSSSQHPRSSPQGAGETRETAQHNVIDFALPRPIPYISHTTTTTIAGDTGQDQALTRGAQAQNCSVTPTEPSQALDRALTSSLPVRGLSRRVTIRPADLIIKHDDRNVSFRETIVTTPYPPRRTSDQFSMNFESKSQDSNSDSGLDREKKGNKGGKVIMPASPSAGGSSPAKGEKDRFPSPERPEVLFINLSLLNHPAARTTVEIQISDKGTFDDELFFDQIRTAYFCQLLGFARIVMSLFRKVGNATITSPTNYGTEDFDSMSFIRHFNKPSLGRKRKAWVIWLRNHNPRHLEPTLAIPASALLITANKAPEPGEHGVQPFRRLSNLKSLSSPTRSSSHSNATSANHSRHSSHHNSNKSVHTDRDINNADLTKRFSTVSQASSYNFVYSPAFPRLPFLSSRHENQPLLAHPASPITAGLSNPCRTYFWPSSSSSTSRCGQVGSITDTETNTVKIVTASFHHRYRVGVIAALTILDILLAVLVTATWVVFGVPGARPEGHSYDHTKANVSGQANAGHSMDWEIDANKRVLAGVVIGLVTLLVGSIAEGMMIWAARELL